MFDVASLLRQFSPATYGINLFDFIFTVIIVFYAYEGYSLGLILAMSDLSSFILSFIIALKIYPVFAKILITLFSLPIGAANAIAFFVVALVSEIALSLILRKLFSLIPKLPPSSDFAKVFVKIDRWLGIVPGMVSAFIVLSFLLSVIVSFPSSPAIKQLVADSKIGSRLVANTSFFENKLNNIFGGALNETLNFLTVKPEGSEIVTLHFLVPQGTVDEIAEQKMFHLVNDERSKAGLPTLTFDNKLRDVARAHSKDMFARGYFSHYNPEGLSPFDRMERAGINFTYAGENLALAPSTDLAMLGLMNSPGHRANILSPNFKKIGIGVIDGGIYGKMYSQEFTD